MRTTSTQPQLWSCSVLLGSRLVNKGGWWVIPGCQHPPSKPSPFWEGWWRNSGWLMKTQICGFLLKTSSERIPGVCLAGALFFQTKTRHSVEVSCIPSRGSFFFKKTCPFSKNVFSCFEWKIGNNWNWIFGIFGKSSQNPITLLRRVIWNCTPPSPPH